MSRLIEIDDGDAGTSEADILVVEISDIRHG